MIIQKKELPNKIRFFLLEDSLINSDLIIKFKNYGAALDKYYNIYGFQHLLEHTIFANKNLNIPFNGYTTFSDMFVTLDLNDKYYSNDSSINLLKKWLFKNNIFNKIDLSVNFPINNIKKYMSEINNEYIYRQTLNIPWPLNMFLLSNGESHSFCGTDTTFYNKENDIQKILSNPISILPDDVIIFLRKSKSFYYPYLKEIFSQIKRIKRENIVLPIETTPYDNKIININYNSSNQLTFVINKDLVESSEILLLIKSFFPFFSYEDNIYLNNYFVYFSFTDFDSLYQFMEIIKNDLLKLFDNNELIYTFLDEFTIDNYSDNTIDLINSRQNMKYSFKNYFTKHKYEVLNFMNIIKNLISENKFIINSKKDALHNKITEMDERYQEYPIILNDDYIFNISIKNGEINNLTFFNKENIQNNYVRYNDNRDKLKLERNIKNELFCNPNKMSKKIIKYNEPGNISTKCTPKIYYLALLNHFLSNYTKLEQSIQDILYYKTFHTKFNKNLKIKLSNQIKEINTEFDFVFCAIKLKKSNVEIIFNERYSIQELIKREGYAYYLNADKFLFNNYGILFFFTQTTKENFNKIINIIKSSLITRGINQSEYYFIKSYKNKMTSINYDNIIKRNTNIVKF